MNDTQKKELLETLFGMVVHFVDMGFSNGKGTCGQTPGNSRNEALLSDDMLQSTYSMSSSGSSQNATNPESEVE